MPAEDRDRLFEKALARHLRDAAGGGDSACLDAEMLVLITKVCSRKKRRQRPRIISSLARVAGKSCRNLRRRRASVNYEIRKMDWPLQRYRGQRMTKFMKKLPRRECPLAR